MLKRISIAALIAGGAFMLTPASAQVSLGVGADVDLGVNVRVGEPYTYNGYRSERWYPYTEPHRSGRYYETYGGYDCYRAFQYTWEDEYQARYDAYWCFDDRGREYEVRETRASVRVR
jgi:hypothetical protein